MKKFAILMVALGLIAGFDALSAQSDDAAAIQANCANEHPADAERQGACYEANMQAMRDVLAVAREHPERTPEQLSEVRARCEAASQPGDYVAVARCFRGAL